MLQLNQLGNVVTFTQQHLRATFPTLPQEQIGGRGGYYGVLKPPGPGIDDSLHNLYEEIPCLGVLSEAIMHAISDEPAGPYQSVVTYESLQPNNNLIGFRPLNPHRHQDAKNIAFSADISASHFPDYPANTAINLTLLMSISSILKGSKGFKISKVNFSTLSEAGSASQTIVSRPLTIERQTNLMSTINTTSLARNSHDLFGEACLFCSQLMKDSGSDADHTRWCMISPAAGLPIPPQWVDNRNQRRNLPTQYMQEVWGGYHSVHNMVNA
ncbi:uncharacterized protein LOC111029553 [Myzus persicae]|uniref:uncharacterized protein LOC111029553 n=1 Tax=Myzus persicae TaxID=13164 RepID=UPI000B937904|nr:uncharacterized protein LOC111029553 [Myzus persicae]